MVSPMDELGVGMAFSNLFKKASNLFGLASPDRNKPPPLDGEIIYCKNNVCVHPPAALSTEMDHYPGYLNIRSQDDEVLGSTLILTWIPNSTLQKNPRSIENSPAHPKVSPRRSPRQEYAKSDQTPSSTDESGISSPEGFSDAKPPSTDEISLSSESSVELPKEIRVRLPSETKSTSDSGILSGSSVKSQIEFPISEPNQDEEKQNNTKDRSDRSRMTGVGQNVNTIHNDLNVNKVNGDERLGSSSSLSSDSEGVTMETQLNSLVGKSNNKMKHPLTEQIRETEKRKRSSSSRSVTSIEMEGDSLVVVTEETDENDQTFLEDGEIDKLNHNEAHHCNGNDDCRNTADTTCGSEEEGKLPLPSDTTERNSMSSDSTQSSPRLQRYQRMIDEMKNNTQGDTKQVQNGSSDTLDPSVCSDSAINSDGEKSPMEKLKESLDLKLNLSGTDSAITMPNISITDSSSRRTGSMSSCSSTPTSGPDSNPPSPGSPPFYPTLSPHNSPFSDSDPLPQAYSSPENYGVTYNMSFPENSVNFGAVCSPEGMPSGGKSAKDQVCGVFSVDLGQMRSLRVFYSDERCSSGQLVIASRESQYKILHFHHGGLDRLAETFTDWKFLAQPVKQQNDLDLHCKHFSVIRPHLAHGQSHPEEGAFVTVNEETWQQHMNEIGQIQDDYHLRKAIFFAGLEPALRHEMWPFLLHYYPYNSTIEDREHIRNDKYIEYQNLRKARENLPPEEHDRFWRSVQCIVEKDVIRTDRSHPYFKGADNPNIEVLKNVLLNYAVAYPRYGYTQGMSDLLAPVLVEVQNEVDAYWCFVGLMQKTIFVSSPKDIDMDKQLIYLRALLKMMLPTFYEHICNFQDGLELLFCHRWILLCFKREFPEVDALRMWEACWAHYQTDYFHLFICVAIIAVYGEDVVEQDLPADEMLLHFSSLSMHMNGEVVLKKARGLLHQFRTYPKIPCTLEGLCTLCGPGMWDSGHVPTVECVGNHDDDLCPFGGKPPKKPAS